MSCSRASVATWSDDAFVEARVLGRTPKRHGAAPATCGGSDRPIRWGRRRAVGHPDRYDGGDATVAADHVLASWR
jgi:hypothetical protein